MSAPVVGTVYLLHLQTPYRHAKHYTGWSANLPARLADHEAGRGARLLAVTTEAGIHAILARTWPGVTREVERRLKRQGGASRRCPVCGVTPKPHPPSPHWDAVMVGGAVVSLHAECESCHRRKALFGFDQSIRDTRICWDCAEPPAPLSRPLALATEF